MDFIEKFKNYINNEGNPLNDSPIIFQEAVALMILSSVAQRRYFFYFAGKKTFCNIWMLIVAKSSMFRKSTIIGNGIDIIEQIDRNIKLPNEFSTEELIAILDRNPQGTFFVDEFSTFYLQFLRNYMATGIGFLLEMFDRVSSYQRKLRSGETFYIKDPFINIISATTLTALERELKAKDIENGFLYRFCIVYCNKQEKEIELPLSKPQPKLLEPIITHLQKIRENSQYYEFTKKAQENYIEWYHKVKRDYKEYLTGHFSSYLTRLLVYCLKFCLLYHLAREDFIKPQLDENDMNNAINWTNRLIQSTFRVLNLIAYTEYERHRRRILQYLANNHEITEEKSYYGVSKSRLLRYMKLEAGQLTRILNSLKEEEVIKEEQIKPSDSHKPLTIYYICDENELENYKL
jgi:hypothetical protein